MSHAIALPLELQHLAGRISDVDAHEMTPAQKWVDRFGEEVRELVEFWVKSPTTDQSDVNSPNIPTYAGVNDRKGCKAPGAVDLKRRLEVMDAMGIRRQLLFPTGVGMWASLKLAHSKFDPSLLKGITGDRVGYRRNSLDKQGDRPRRWTFRSHQPYRLFGPYLTLIRQFFVLRCARTIEKGLSLCLKEGTTRTFSHKRKAIDSETKKL